MFVLLWVYFPPEFFTEILCAATHALKMVEVIGWNSFEDFSHATHGEKGKAIACTGVVQMPLKESHEFTALGLF